MTFKKLIGLLHLWLGLASGLVVFILGITGCIYAFEEEIRDVVYQNHLYVQPLKQPKLPVSKQFSIAQKTLGRAFDFTNFEISNTPNGSSRFFAYKSDEKAITYFGSREYAYNIYLNPYTGSVLKVENNKYEFFTLVLYLHYDLLLGKIGKQIVGWSTIIFIVLLLSGLVLWWPKNKAAAKQRVWFQWKAGTKWKRKNYDLHNVVGFYFLGICLIIALTGLVWAFSWFNESVQYLVNGGSPLASTTIVYSDTTAYTSKLAVDEIDQDITKRIPDALSYSYIIPKKKEDALTVNALFTGTKRFKFVTHQYDQHSGKFLQNRRYESKPAAEKLRNMNYDIHVGSILGLPGKVLAFLASFVAASLPVTGFAIWWGRRKKSKKDSGSKANSVHPAKPFNPKRKPVTLS